MAAVAEVVMCLAVKGVKALLAAAEE